jgi:flavin reductase (NADH)/flavin reductase
MYGIDPTPPKRPFGSQDFKAGMRKLAAAVTLITVYGAEGRNGLTATAVCSVSAEPPHLLCCVNRTATAFATLRAVKIFAVNVLKPEHQALAERFARPPAGEDRFAGGDWTMSPAGAPVLESALAWFDCRLVNLTEVGSHGIALALVTACGFEDGGSHLLYADGTYKTL